MMAALMDFMGAWDAIQASWPLAPAALISLGIVVGVGRYEMLDDDDQDL